LIADMTAKEPSTHPTIEQVVVRFDQIRRSLYAWKLRSRPIPLKNFFRLLVTLFRAIPHWFRRISYVLRGIPPVPVPTLIIYIPEVPGGTDFTVSFFSNRSW
ncbi:hypothetical protein C8R43DRAFT_889544, partial [Mycena crocata]